MIHPVGAHVLGGAANRSLETAHRLISTTQRPTNAAVNHRVRTRPLSSGERAAAPHLDLRVARATPTRPPPAAAPAHSAVSVFAAERPVVLCLALLHSPRAQLAVTVCPRFHGRPSVRGVTRAQQRHSYREPDAPSVRQTATARRWRRREPAESSLLRYKHWPPPSWEVSRR